ncbi:aldo/keto reductase [Spirosoma montaniterrae]|uniref:Oxidoreductase n=1 Tax=Spirosoma montaniterrae TaxID=1178516 RepID=A0A1P9WZB3_9BACT|nr:aldo/keto reductase [Spirosoma montaniterrae]AQG80721.1 oxidoreductase [Spirosoma montaniterrae]
MKPTYKPDIYSSTFPAHGSRLVYGTSGLGGVWGAVDPGESVDCLLYALENGITSLDTSPSYSNSETYVGKALRRWEGERPFLSTKVGRLQAATAHDARLDYSVEGMTNSIKRSLDLLGVDSVDLLFLHEPQWVPLDRIDEILDTLQSFREAGYTRMLGIGGNPSPEFRPYIRSKVFQVVSTFCRMDACNLSAFDEEVGLYQQQNIAVYAASALHFSLLGNRFETYTKQPPVGDDYISDRDIQNAIRVNEIAKKHGLPLPTLAQRYLFSMAEATRVVMGARTIPQIQNTINDWRQGALPEEVFDEITNTIAP